MSSTAIAQRPKFSAAIQTDGYKKLINNTLQDPKRAQRFIASVSSAVAVNPALQECDAGSILSCALLGESLNLSPSPQLGQYYMVPFGKKAKYDGNGNMTTPAMKIATFILGYKGYIQLAIRSGQYKKLNVLAIKKGELVRFDPLNEEIQVELISDELTREAAETIGYYAMFEYSNGFRKAIYWSKEKMIQHATRHSTAFGSTPAKGDFPGRVSFDDYLAGKYKKKDEWVYSSFWYKDFDGMAYKTMLRQLISKWGVMSIEMQQALESDDAAVNPDMTPNYIADDPDMPSISISTDDEGSAEPIDDATVPVDNDVPQVSMKDI